MPRPYRVLFLCTANSARSIIAESILNALGGGRFEAFSAGSHPSGRVNPLAIDVLMRNGYPVHRVRSKGWEEFAGKGAPPIDFVITVCDNAAEECPVFPGATRRLHWSFPDPAAVEGSDEARLAAFQATLDGLRDIITYFIPIARQTIPEARA